MQNVSKSQRRVGEIYLTEIKLFFSIIAILLAGTFKSANAVTTTNDIIMPIEKIIEDALKSCPFPHSINYCFNDSTANNSCGSRTDILLKNLNTSPLVNASMKPLCKSPSNSREPLNES